MHSSILSIGILTVPLRCVTWGLVAAFAYWLYRHKKLNEWPWLAIYWLLAFPALPYLNAWLLKRFMPDDWASGLFGSVILWSNIGQIVAAVTGIMLALLILPDLASLAEQAGVPLDNKAVRLLLKLRPLAPVCGLILICSATLSQVIWTVMMTH